MKKSHTLASELKKNIIELIESSTSHGIPNIFRNKHFPMKLIWLIFFLVSTGGCVYSILQSFSQFFDYGVTTTVRIQNEIPALFPKITICNRNGLNTYTGYELLSFIASYYNQSSSNMDTDSTEFRNSVYEMALINMNNYSNKKKLGYELKEILIKCTFSYRNCGPDQFEYIYNSIYGNCYSFNTGKNSSTGESIPFKKAYFAGYLGGLTLELYAGLNDGIDKYFPYNGIVVFIGNNSYPIKYLNEIHASAGKETNIAVEKTFVTQIPVPYSGCISDVSADNSVLYKNLIEANIKYNQQDCFTQCFQKKVEDLCESYNPFFLPISRNNSCNYVQYICLIETMKSFLNGEYSDECFNLCPIECEKSIYSYYISQSSSFSRSYAEGYMKNELIKSKFGNKTITYEEVKNSIVKVNIYFDGLRYTEIEETPSVTLFNLISNIGGTLGLFIGISLLSFIEIIEIFYELLVTIVKYKQNISKVKLNQDEIMNPI